jgi:hypothetical protein
MPVRPQSIDTHPDAERVHIELLRRAGLARRVALALSLSRTTVEMSRDAIRRRHPDWTETAVLVEFVALCYGEALGEKLKLDLERRSGG